MKNVRTEFNLHLFAYCKISGHGNKCPVYGGYTELKYENLN